MISKQIHAHPIQEFHLEILRGLSNQKVSSSVLIKRDRRSDITTFDKNK